jgi:hypothetical protein
LTGSSFELYQTLSGTTFSYNDTGLSQAQAYYYYVVAVDDLASSADSNTVTETIAVPITPALSGSLSGTGTALSWTASTVQGSTIAHYYLYREVATGGFSLYQTLSGSTTTYTDVDLTNGVTYSYYVYAESADSRTSADSNTVALDMIAGLTTFTLEFAEAGGQPTNGTYQNGTAGYGNEGTLVSGGGVGGLAVADLNIAGTSGAINFTLSASETYFGSNPFTSRTTFWATIAWTDKNGSPQSLSSSSGSYSSGSSSTGYYFATWNYSSGAGAGVVANTSYAFTVTV